MAQLRKFRYHRNFERAVMSGRVYIHDESRLFIAPLNNIGGGGVFIDGVTSIPLGSSVRIVVKSPEINHAIQAKGEIVRIESDHRSGSAVVFSQISKQDQRIIKGCVQQKEPEQLVG